MRFEKPCTQKAEPYLLKQNGGSLSGKYGVARVFILLVISILIDVSVGLVEKPENEAVLFGEDVTVTLKCKTNLSDVNLQWSNVKGEIFDGRDLNPATRGYAVDKTPQGTYNLQFKASPEMATLYTCFEPRTEDRQSVEVIVIEKAPSCNVSATSSKSVTFTCRIMFTGNWAPNLTWDFNHTDDGSRVDISQRTDGNLLESNLKISFNSSLDGKFSPVCQTKFVKENYRGRATTQYPPQYSDRCPVEYVSESTTLNVPVPNSESINGGAIAGIVIAILVAVGGVVGVLLYVQKRQSDSKKPESPSNGKNDAELRALHSHSSKPV